jgi:hypothetical protein
MSYVQGIAHIVVSRGRIGRARVFRARVIGEVVLEGAKRVGNDGTLWLASVSDHLGFWERFEPVP